MAYLTNTPPREAAARAAKARESEELARWLREAGHRKSPPPRDLELSAPAERPAASAQLPLRIGPPPYVRLSIFALLAASYLEYFFANVLLLVYSVHSIVVFV